MEIRQKFDPIQIWFYFHSTGFRLFSALSTILRYPHSIHEMLKRMILSSWILDGRKKKHTFSWKFSPNSGSPIHSLIVSVQWRSINFGQSVQTVLTRYNVSENRVETRGQSYGNQANVWSNRPFYSCVPGDLAFEWKRGWRWPCFDTNPPAFHM